MCAHLVEVGVQRVGAQHFGDLNELIVVVVPVKKRLLSENHACIEGGEVGCLA